MMLNRDSRLEDKYVSLRLGDRGDALAEAYATELNQLGGYQVRSIFMLKMLTPVSQLGRPDVPAIRAFEFHFISTDQPTLFLRVARSFQALIVNGRTATATFLSILWLCISSTHRTVLGIGTEQPHVKPHHTPTP